MTRSQIFIVGALYTRLMNIQFGAGDDMISVLGYIQLSILYILNPTT